MSWVILIFAGIFEIVWAVGIKYADGLTKIWPSAITIAGMIISFYLLSIAIRHIPLGTAYAVWTGIGTIGTVLYGMIFFKEPADIWRILCIMLIVCGITGLRILTKQ